MVQEAVYNRKWWKESVVYQIYPRSFMDTNGDGIGDLKGITSKLDYLRDLGIDVIWICPFYKSPNDDNGYDISDYYAVSEEFGTMEDFEQLLAEAHRKGIKVIADLVLNHTSDEHPWFVEARASQDSPKRDYYIWREGKEKNEPPSNWGSFFGGSAWEFDEQSKEYYLHIFNKKQPDLNWENPLLIEELHQMVRWWLDKGLDGFRIDAINHIVKLEGFPDVEAPAHEKNVTAHHFFSNLPKVHDHIQHLNRKVFSDYDIMTVGEAANTSPEEALLYVDEKRDELNMVFHFEHISMDNNGEGIASWEKNPWPLSQLKGILNQWQTKLHGKGWNANFWSNHDQPRAVSRFGNDQEYRIESAKLLATLMFMLEGTPYIYQGEEIGMTNIQLPSIDDYRDSVTHYFYRQAQREGWAENRIMGAIHQTSRDNARTPMQWNGDAHGGFTTGTPWISANPNASWINVESAEQDPNSILNYYKQLIALRKQYLVAVYGKYEAMLLEHPSILAFTRTLGNEQLAVVMNFSATSAQLDLTEALAGKSMRLLLSNVDRNTNETLVEDRLGPYESRIYIREATPC
ncbi:glycoside hydrolase family 13 protein [Paenibacillus sp. MMS18-CY102]|uniref:glycoside hydrolase family 13 protein n=1 Tax=Paenibacillus sp. MMS18-CY102 TaxID=2682849 RepID=UPI001365F1A2|nr:alpha-glucosidase [Paenibacillus sp. MMS18-CY102]MWC28147.1 alpha,alpha-phosphotrehalase [Paenibacillus sp. MMS18-CY102]